MPVSRSFRLNPPRSARRWWVGRANEVDVTRSPQRLVVWPLHLALAVLFFGPLIAPLFRASGLPLIADAGWLARELLATYVCPTPAKSWLLLGFPMAVCARCWGATIGLLLARSLFTTRPLSSSSGALGRLMALHWPWRLLLCALPFLLWPLEIIGEAQGWWYAPYWLLLLNGAQAGFAAGLFFCSLWKGLRVGSVRFYVFGAQ